MKKIINPALSLKTLCDLDFEASERLYMIDSDPTKFGCVTTQEINGQRFPHDSNIKVLLDDIDVSKCIYANDITNTVIRYERDLNGEIVLNRFVPKIAILKGDVKIFIEKEDVK